MTTTTQTSLLDAESAVHAWIRDRAPTTLNVIPPGVRIDTVQFETFVQWSFQGLSRTPASRKNIPFSTGDIRADVYVSRHQDANTNVFDLARIPATTDDLVGTLELAQIPVFDMRAFRAASGVSTTLTSTVTAGATTVTVDSVAGFATPSGEIVLGAERISYTGISGTDLTGCTRGVGQTTAFAHTAGTPVASALGAEIAYIDVSEADIRPLGWDVAAQRERTLILLPFTLGYDTL